MVKDAIDEASSIVIFPLGNGVSSDMRIKIFGLVQTVLTP